jgi:protease-4
MTQVSLGVAETRKLDERTVRSLIGKGPFLANEAKSAGLVDQLGYRDQAEETMARIVADADDIDVSDYASHLNDSGVGIAVITGQGAIKRGGKDDAFGGNDEGFASDMIAQAFHDAVDDDHIKGILFRVDSPGGSYTASDILWREVVLARAAGKPVVVSMGEMAASGGYFVGMAADKVVAEPGTITGSIGVFTGKMVLKDLWAKLGVGWDGLAKGDNAAMWSANHSFTPAQWDRVNLMLDQIYKDFTGKAVDGRHIPSDKIDQMARGRVWSGADAKRMGLVDELGGFNTALTSLKGILKESPDAPVDLVAFPQPKSAIEMIRDMMEQGVYDRVALAKIASTIKILSPIVEAFQARSAGAQLMAPHP